MYSFGADANNFWTLYTQIGGEKYTETYSRSQREGVYGFSELIGHASGGYSNKTEEMPPSSMLMISVVLPL
jgi:hypothetical protein